MIFFLNPQVPFNNDSLLRGIFFYSSILAPISLMVLLAVTRWKRQAMEQWSPIALTVVMVSGALMFWTHAYYFGFYLPPGINKRLLKAAIFLSLSAVIGFYTLLLHRMRQRRYGRRAWVIFALLAAASIYVVVERREAYQPRIEPTPRPTTFNTGTRPLLCVIGIDTATFDVILPLAEQGRLPFFRKALSDGAQARLVPLEPTYPGPLWTTLITGKYPYKHGIVGDRKFQAPFLSTDEPLFLLPLAVGFKHWGVLDSSERPNRLDIRSVPLWDVLTRLDMSTALIGWPLSGPVSSEIHLALSDDFFESAAFDPRLAHPNEIAERARLFKPSTESLEEETLSRFGASPPEVVVDALIQDRWRQDLAFFLLDQDPEIDALFLHLPGLRQVSESYFGGYSAVQFKGVGDEASIDASRLLAAYYADLDDFLGSLEEAIQRPKLLVLVSVHGVGRITGLSELQRWIKRQPATHGDLDDGAPGVLMLLGDGIQPTQSIRTAHLVDLPSTLLYGLGLPVARDLAGSVLVEIFSPAAMSDKPLTFVPSYETLARRPSISAADPQE